MGVIVTALSRFLVVLVVVDFGELRVDHVILGGILGRIGLGLLLVHGLAELHRGLRQRIGLGLDRFGIIALQRFLEVADGIFNRAALGVRNLRSMLGKRLLGGMHQRIGVVLGVDRLAALLVLGRIGLGILDHLVDVGFGQTAGCLDADLLFLARRLVLGRHVDDAVGVDVEGHLDLRHAARCRRNTHQIELAEYLVVGRHFALALEDADGNRVLTVLGGREYLALLGRDR